MAAVDVPFPPLPDICHISDFEELLLATGNHAAASGVGFLMDFVDDIDDDDDDCESFILSDFSTTCSSNTLGNIFEQDNVTSPSSSYGKYQGSMKASDYFNSIMVEESNSISTPSCFDNPIPHSIPYPSPNSFPITIPIPSFSYIPHPNPSLSPYLNLNPSIYTNLDTNPNLNSSPNLIPIANIDTNTSASHIPSSIPYPNPNLNPIPSTSPHPNPNLTHIAIPIPKSNPIPSPSTSHIPSPCLDPNLSPSPIPSPCLDPNLSPSPSTSHIPSPCLDPNLSTSHIPSPYPSPNYNTSSSHIPSCSTSCMHNPYPNLNHSPSSNPSFIPYHDPNIIPSTYSNPNYSSSSSSIPSCSTNNIPNPYLDHNCSPSSSPTPSPNTNHVPSSPYPSPIWPLITIIKPSATPLHLMHIAPQCPSMLKSHCNQALAGQARLVKDHTNIEDGGFLMVAPKSCLESVGIYSQGVNPLASNDGMVDTQTLNVMLKSSWPPLHGHLNSDETKVKIGHYTLEERMVRLNRYRLKRSKRNFDKKVKYDCRKILADRRPRIRGRFARNDDIEETP